MRQLFRRPSPAMVVACLALLVALGGTSVAAVSQLVPRNSVGTAQLRDNAVARVKVRNNAINSSKVQNRSLLAVDFANGQIPAGPAGPAGSAGPAGPAGAAGVAGPPGVSGYEIVESSLTVTSQFITSHTVNCPAGKRALGGGVRSNTLSFAGPYLVNSNPTAGGAGWTASFAREVQSSWTYVVYAICGVVTT